MKVVKIPQTKKNIYIDDNLVSLPRAMLATQMFAISKRVEELDIEVNDAFGYKFLRLKGVPLNLGIDFKLVVSIVKLLNESPTSNFVSMTFDHFYNFLDDKKSQPQNKNKTFIKRLDESAERISSLKIRVEDHFGRITHGSLFSVNIDPVTKMINIIANGIVRNLFEIDNNAIYNIDFRIYDKLELEYSRKLYMFYLTHNVAEENKLSIKMMKDSLSCVDMEDKKFNENVKHGNTELLARGFLESVKKGYDKGDARTVKRYLVTVNKALNKKARKEKEEQAKTEKEVNEYKKAADSKPVVVVKTQATIDFEKQVEESKAMFKELSDDPTQWF